MTYFYLKVMTKTIILADAHFAPIYQMSNYVEREISDNSRIIFLGDFADNIKNIDYLSVLQRKKPDEITILAGNHEESPVEGFIITSGLFEDVKKEPEEVYNEIIRSPNFSFIEELVRKEKEEFHKQKKIKTINISNYKIGLVHAAPLKYAPVKEANPYFWSRLLNTETNDYNLNRVLETFKYMTKNRLQGLLRGHDHEPALFILNKDKGLIEYSLRGKVQYSRRGKRAVQIDEIPISLRIIDPVKEEDLFIFNPGPFAFGLYGEIEEQDGALQLQIKNIEENIIEQKTKTIDYLIKPPNKNIKRA